MSEARRAVARIHVVHGIVGLVRGNRVVAGRRRCLGKAGIALRLGEREVVGGWWKTKGGWICRQYGRRWHEKELLGLRGEGQTLEGHAAGYARAREAGKPIRDRGVDERRRRETVGRRKI